MNIQSEPPFSQLHWQYAAGQAFNMLEIHVREFCFERYANGHTYSGFQPSYFVKVVDGFLNEDSQFVPKANRNALEQLRKFLECELVPVFETGRSTAKENWQESEKEYGSLSTPALHELANQKSPFANIQHEWFLEGFCQSWANEEFEGLRQSDS